MGISARSPPSSPRTSLPSHVLFGRESLTPFFPVLFLSTSRGPVPVRSVSTSKPSLRQTSDPLTHARYQDGSRRKSYHTAIFIPTSLGNRQRGPVDYSGLDTFISFPRVFPFTTERRIQQHRPARFFTFCTDSTSSRNISSTLTVVADLGHSSFFQIPGWTRITLRHTNTSHRQQGRQRLHSLHLIRITVSR